MMVRLTAQTDKQFGTVRKSRGIVVDGSVDISVWDGAAFVATESLTTGTYELFTYGLLIRFAPTGSVAYDDSDGSGV